MANVGEWAPQIIASIIGSSLIVTALTLSISILNKPVISITLSYGQWHGITNYTTNFKNIGYSPAHHVRLTLFYPSSKILGNTTKYQNENMTVNEEEPNSVVVFLPRLASDGQFEIMTNISGKVIHVIDVNKGVTPLGDYGYDSAYYHYYHGIDDSGHPIPFSIIATYDEGSNSYVPGLFFVQPNQYYDTNKLIILITTVLGFLAFAIGFRHKRKSRTKFILNVLNDIKTAKEKLSRESSMAIISALKWDPSYIVRHQFFDSYSDYQIIYKFYNSLKKRDVDLSENPSDQCLLKKKNVDCLTQAQDAYTKIIFLTRRNLHTKYDRDSFLMFY